MASAPPEDEPEPTPPPPPRQPIRLDSEQIIGRVAEFLAISGDVGTLLSLALTARAAHTAVVPVLFASPTLASLVATRSLSETVAESISYSRLVKGLTIKPSDASVVDMLPPLAVVLQVCDIQSLDEDLTTGDWDVTTLQRDYPRIAARLRSLTSRRCWWEIGAVCELLKTQPEIIELKFLGAVMDREWEGERLNGLPAPVPLAPHLTSITIGQVLHEETLTALFRTSGTASLKNLRLGFETIDDDTPRASISGALRLVASSLTHLALRAPSKASPDAAGLLDEILPLLAHLEVLEFSEQADGAFQPVPIATNKVLSVLPSSLRVLRARNVVSFSTSRLLAMLNEPSGIPVLEELEVFWAEDQPGHEVQYRQRHEARIEEACRELGIQVAVGRSEVGLAAW